MFINISVGWVGGRKLVGEGRQYESGIVGDNIHNAHCTTLMYIVFATPPSYYEGGLIQR